MHETGLERVREKPSFIKTNVMSVSYIVFAVTHHLLNKHYLKRYEPYQNITLYICYLLLWYYCSSPCSPCSKQWPSPQALVHHYMKEGGFIKYSRDIFSRISLHYQGTISCLFTLHKNKRLQFFKIFFQKAEWWRYFLAMPVTTWSYFW